jgi:hypothetical protein
MFVVNQEEAKEKNDEKEQEQGQKPKLKVKHDTKKDKAVIMASPHSVEVSASLVRNGSSHHA